MKPTTPTPAENVLYDVLMELARARGKHPGFPVCPFHALAIIGEEFGELQQAVLQSTYGPDKGPPKHTPTTDELRRNVRLEALQTAASLVQFVLSLDADKFVFKPSEMHFGIPKEPTPD